MNFIAAEAIDPCVQRREFQTGAEISSRMTLKDPRWPRFKRDGQTSMIKFPIIFAALFVAAAALYLLLDLLGPRPTPEQTRLYETVESYLDPEHARSGMREFESVFSDALETAVSKHVDSPNEAALIDAALDGVLDLQPSPGGDSAERLIDAALQGMVRPLDAHSSYISSETNREVRIQVEGEFGGLGMELTMEPGPVTVVAPLDGTPAHRAGVETGDVITRIDRESLSGLTLAEVVARLRGKAGTKVTVTLERSGQEPVDLSLVREEITVRAVTHRAEGNAGYIRLAVFSKQALEQLRHAVEALRSQLGAANEGFVLDLRRNPGGLMSESANVADAFLDHGVIVKLRRRDGKDDESLAAEAGDIAQNLPMVVLVDGGSAGGAELVAAALQHHGRAVLMGTRTYGKIELQTHYRLPGSRALRITTARYADATGKPFDSNGLEPDVPVQGDTEPGEGEPGETGFLSESQCPPIGADEDRVLGCALKLLRAGSVDAFRAELGS